jgi:Uma2 family endonuclease
MARTASLPTHRWDRRQYEQLVEAGVLTDEDRVELIDGRIVTMSPQNSRHATAVTLCRQALDTVCPDGYFVRTQAPLALGSHSEPEPDLALIAGAPTDFWDDHPTTAALVVEVADTSLDKDRNAKRQLYATHEIPEYWIVNLDAARVEVYRDPDPDDYNTKTTFDRSELIALSAVDADPIAVSDLLPNS